MLRRWTPWLNRLARRRDAMVVAVAVLAFCASIGLTWLRGVPLPGVADEFSYLLAADTFAHGRLTNPPHPFWQHFESAQVLQQPTYASKYPPGQGLVLALGRWLAGRPIFGVWLSTALACGATAWALFGWLPPRWALFGSVAVALHPVVLGEWGQSYWGGAVALAGGALVIGAVPRILAGPCARDSLAMALGAAILLLSRPFEGGLVTATAAATLMPRLWRLPHAVVARQVAVPAVFTLALAATWLGYYDYRVTGKATLMPYVLHHETYEVAPLFVWQQPRPEPAYRHLRMREQFVGWALMRSDMKRMPMIDSRVYDFDKPSLREFFVSALRRGRMLLLSSAHPQLVVGLLFAGPFAVVTDRRFRRALVILAVLGVGLSITTYLSPHYAAPGVAIAAVAVVQALRHLRLWRWRGRRVGRWLTGLAIALWVLTTPFWLYAITRPPPAGYALKRARFVDRLSRGGERHLVIVRYRPVARFDIEWAGKPEWIYNGADIDSAPVVFAREMNPAADRALVEYFGDRRVWLFEPEANPPKLEPYRPGD